MSSAVSGTLWSCAQVFMYFSEKYSSGMPNCPVLSKASHKNEEPERSVDKKAILRVGMPT